MIQAMPKGSSTERTLHRKMRATVTTAAQRANRHQAISLLPL